jgi:hypothetical protein
MSYLTQIIGGSFQDASGAPIAKGTLILKLDADSATVPPLSEIGAARVITVTLDAIGKGKGKNGN